MKREQLEERQMAIEVEKEKKRKDGIEQQSYVASEGDIEMVNLV